MGRHTLSASWSQGRCEGNARRGDREDDRLIKARSQARPESIVDVEC